MSDPIYARWAMRAGKTVRFETDAGAWLPSGASLTSFTPDFAGTPLSSTPAVISANIAQLLITAAADERGTFVVPVDVEDSLGESDRQAFIMEVQ